MYIYITDNSVKLQLRDHVCLSSLLTFILFKLIISLSSIETGTHVIYQVWGGTVKTDRSEKTIHISDETGRSEISTSTSCSIEFNQYHELLHLAC